MRGLLRNIVVLLVSVFVCGSVMGATYTTKNNVNGKFEDASTWSGGNLPGIYESGVSFTINNSSTVEIKGKVYLNGHLNFLGGSHITLKSGSTLVVDGDLNISDYCYIDLESNASLYIKGDFKTQNLSNSYSYVEVYMSSNANVVVRENMESTAGANAYFVYQHSNADLYVFGSISGNAYYDSWSTQTAGKENNFLANEHQLSKTVNEMTSTLQDAKSFDFYRNGCTLEIPSNTVVEIPQNATVYLSNITMGEGSTFINNGTVKIVEDCNNENSAYKDFNFDKNCYQYVDNSHSGNTFRNNGSFYCKNYNQKIITEGASHGNNTGQPIYWTNTGSIICSENFNMEVPQTHFFNSICGSSVRATNMNFHSHKELTLDGIYNCSVMTIDLTNGGNTVNFGSNCSTNDVSVMNQLILKNNISYLNIDGVSTLNGINADTYSSVTVQIEGELYVGNTSNKVTITGNSDSRITLCYNANVCDHKTDKTSSSSESCGDGYARTTGTVIFRVPIDGEDEKSNHAWYHNSPFNEYTGNKDYISSYDVQDLGGATLIPNSVSYENCINRQFVRGSLLPIELVSFNFDKSSNEFIWTTASEKDNDYFVVEYSKNGKDWVECTEHVQSQSDNGYTYGTEPIMPINESLFSYFRLKQVDLNGEFSYSDVITISFTVDNPCSEEYEDSKMQIREFGNRYYRLINGELIYCENDNE